MRQNCLLLLTVLYASGFFSTVSCASSSSDAIDGDSPRPFQKRSTQGHGRSIWAYPVKSRPFDPLASGFILGKRSPELYIEGNPSDDQDEIIDELLALADESGYVSKRPFDKLGSGFIGKRPFDKLGSGFIGKRPFDKLGSGFIGKRPFDKLGSGFIGKRPFDTVGSGFIGKRPFDTVGSGFIGKRPFDTVGSGFIGKRPFDKLGSGFIGKRNFDYVGDGMMKGMQSYEENRIDFLDEAALNEVRNTFRQNKALDTFEKGLISKRPFDKVASGLIKGKRPFDKVGSGLIKGKRPFDKVGSGLIKGKRPFDKVASGLLKGKRPFDKVGSGLIKGKRPFDKLGSGLIKGKRPFDKLGSGLIKGKRPFDKVGSGFIKGKRHFGALANGIVSTKALDGFRNEFIAIVPYTNEAVDPESVVPAEEVDDSFGEIKPFSDLSTAYGDDLEKDMASENSFAAFNNLGES